MWWCCGKPGKDSPGCKFAKHESKEDEDEEDMGDKENLAASKNKNIRC